MSTDTDASTAPTCVIAEDEEILRSALESLLREAWPELSIVASCDDGGSAVEAIAEHQPDVAFLDIRMPGLTGLEVASAARSEEHTSELQSLMRISYAVFCLKKKKKKNNTMTHHTKEDEQIRITHTSQQSE